MSAEAMIEAPETAEFLGLTNRLLATSEQTGGTLSVVEITVPPGGGAPLHTNTREDLTWCVIDGALTFLRDGATHRVGAGHAIFMPKDQPHTFLNETDRPATGLMVCTPGGFERFLTEMAAALPDSAGRTEPLAIMRDVGAHYGMDVAES